MDINSAIKHTMDGNAVLFLGAGFSFGGINSLGSEILTGVGLAHKLCDEMKIAQSDDLTIAASRFIDDEKCKKGLEELIRLLTSELTCADTLETQETIIDLPWIRIYTTNYDNVVEKASNKVRRCRQSITATTKRYSRGRYLDEAIIHINGSINSLDQDKFVDEFKITDDQYVREGFLDSPWADLFRTDLEKSNAIVFIGYSLDYDQDIKKELARLKITDKCIFIDIPALRDDAEYRLSKYGSLYKIGTKGFAEEINSVKSEYVPRIKLKKLNGFTQVDMTDYFTEEHYTSQDVINLIIKGKIVRKFINQKGYCAKRKTKVQEALKVINENKITIVRSKLGNGKTIFVENLASQLCKDKDVYFVNNLDTLQDDLQMVFDNSEHDKILIIDDYGYYIKLIKELIKDFPDNLKMVLTCRSAININLYYDLTNKYGYDENEIDIIDIDLLSDFEITEIVQLLNINRLWGGYDKKSFSQKKNLIKKHYKASISNLFYILLKSEQISKEIEKILREVFRKDGLKDFVLMQAINSLCNLKLEFYDVCKFINISETLVNKYSENPDTNEIIDFHNGKMFTSSIFSQYIIRQNNLINEIMSVLKRLYIESEKGEYNNKYKDQRKMLISRSNIKLVFSTKGSVTESEERNIFNYFDSIKNTVTASKNPFFWLQFSITVLNLEEYNLADIYFKNAYSNVGLLDDFDSYQLDTHKARFLLNKELNTNRTDKSAAISSFEEAHKLLVNNSNSGKNLIYVLKQTGVYYKFYETFSVLFNKEEKKDYIKRASEMSKKYQIYFQLTQIKEIPHEVIINYTSYRKVFNKTEYALLINKLDFDYNSKVKKQYQVNPLDILIES